MKKLMSFFLLFSIAIISLAQSGYKIGDIAEDFKLKNIDGRMITLADIPDAKGYIVIFTCNTCPYAKAYEDRMIKLHNKYAPLGYPIVAINPNDLERAPEDSYEHMQQRAKEKRFPFYYLYDETQVTAKKFGAARTPHTFVIQKEGGKNRVVYIGAIDDSAMNESDVGKTYLADAVDALIGGKKPDPNFTMAIGCTVKWKK